MSIAVQAVQILQQINHVAHLGMVERCQTVPAWAGGTRSRAGRCSVPLSKMTATTLTAKATAVQRSFDCLICRADFKSSPRQEKNLRVRTRAVGAPVPFEGLMPPGVLDEFLDSRSRSRSRGVARTSPPSDECGSDAGGDAGKNALDSELRRDDGGYPAA